jgi:hypothetical protein
VSPRHKKSDEDDQDTYTAAQFGAAALCIFTAQGETYAKMEQAAREYAAHFFGVEPASIIVCVSVAAYPISYAQFTDPQQPEVWEARFVMGMPITSTTEGADADDEEVNDVD